MGLKSSSYVAPSLRRTENSTHRHERQKTRKIYFVFHFFSSSSSVFRYNRARFICAPRGPRASLKSKVFGTKFYCIEEWLFALQNIHKRFFVRKLRGSATCSITHRTMLPGDYITQDEFQVHGSVHRCNNLNKNAN